METENDQQYNSSNDDNQNTVQDLTNETENDQQNSTDETENDQQNSTDKTEIPKPANTNNDLLEKIRRYVETNKPKLYILTPCYGGMCYVNYVTQLMATKDLLRTFGIEMVVLFMRSESLITRGRNNLIAKAMSDPAMTHAIFIDSDITWNPISILKLMIHDKDINGGLYPLKKYYWDRLTKENMDAYIQKKNVSYNSKLSDNQIIYHNLLKYNYNTVGSVDIVNNLLEIYTLATGFMMIKRECIQKMMDSYPLSKYTDDTGFLSVDESKYAYALFDCDVLNEKYLSEDWLFCHRWKEIGGKIYVDVTIDLIHTGQEDFTGRFLSTIVLS